MMEKINNYKEIQLPTKNPKTRNLLSIMKKEKTSPLRKGSERLLNIIMINIKIKIIPDRLHMLFIMPIDIEQLLVDQHYFYYK